VPALVKLLGEDRAAFGEMGLIVGAVITVTMLMTFFGTAGARYTMQSSSDMGLRRHLVWLGRNRPLLVLMGMKACIYAGISSFVAVMLFFLSSVLQKGPAELAVYGLSQTVSTIAFTPAGAWLSRRIGKRRAYAFCLVGFVAVMGTWALATPAEPLALIALRGVVLGAFAAGNFLYGNSMLMDSFAWDYRQTGVRREGILSAAFSFVEKTSLAFGPLVIGVLLSSMGFDKNLPPDAPQSASAVQAMYIGFIWIPMGCQLVAAALLRFYRLEQADLAVD
jgi:GPH family glycoside/pentoside/hexuronide:cation symporter